MFKYVILCACVATAFGDVSHLIQPQVRFSAPTYKPFGTYKVNPTLRPFGTIKLNQVSEQLVNPTTIPVIPEQPHFIRPHAYAAIPATGLRTAAILRQDQDLTPDGRYHYSYETENGIGAQEQGEERQITADSSDKVAQGSFYWTSPEGEQVSISYIADGNGYQPQGSHLPVAPPIPAAILRSLEYNAAHPEPIEQLRRYA